MLFVKYSKQKAITSDQPFQKGGRHLHTKEGRRHLQELLQESMVNHLNKGTTLIYLGHHQVQMHYILFMMTIELCGCHTNKPSILDGEDQDNLGTESPDLSKTDWLLAVLVRITRFDLSERSLAPVRLLEPGRLCYFL
jgi:hypothetical protein